MSSTKKETRSLRPRIQFEIVSQHRFIIYILQILLTIILLQVFDQVNRFNLYVRVGNVKGLFCIKKVGISDI